MSEPAKAEWAVELSMDHANRTYSVRRIALSKSYAYTRVFSVEVLAHDEIGAFNAAQKVLTRLGFRAAEIT